MAILPSVFVSYSREDSNSIQYAVGLLEAGGAEVFRDLDDIRFGERWEEVVTSKITACERMLVFWSKAAQQSEWVGKEYRLGLRLGKTLVPILLDNTPLPPDLGAFHALTLANFMPKAPGWKRYGGWVIGGVATTTLAGVLGFQSLQMDEPLPAPAASQQSEWAIEQNSEQSAESDMANEVINTEAMKADSVAAEAIAVESPTPNAPTSAPITQPASDAATAEVASNTEEPAAEVMVEMNNAPDSEGLEGFDIGGFEPPLYLLWLVGILALLSLCWAALRRYSCRTQLSNQARFVEMVFDDHEWRP